MATEFALSRRQLVPRPLDEVFGFFSSPVNLARITPPWLGFRMVTPPQEMRAGLLIDYRIRPLGIPQRWRSAITVWEPPARFVDEQVVGPYRSWHHLHEFHAVEQGTEIRDTVRYSLPLGPLGQLAHALVVRRQLESIFTYRERVIDELFGRLDGRLVKSEG
jgi:ligand-binding SRPBCC domain-containing protein